MKKIITAVLVSVLLVALAACSGGGGSDTGTTETNSGGGSVTSTAEPEQVAADMSSAPVSMTYDERNSALDKVNAVWTATTSGDLDADNAALADYISTQPEFADAGVSPDQTVWARFKDGRPVVWSTAQRVGIVTAPAMFAGPDAPPVAAPSIMRAGEIPQGDKAVLIDMDGLGRGGPAVVAPWLNKAGYVPDLPAGNLDDLMTKIKNVSVLYFSTHGTFATGQDGKRTYALASAELFGNHSTPTISGKELLWEQMYNEGVLTRAEYQKGSGAVVNYWAITEKFVSTYWTFTPDSLIVVDACSLFDKTTAARAAVGAAFRAPLITNSGGKTTIVGWDNEVYADFAVEAVKLFFDRVLAANAINPESPPQRPFSYKKVFDWMVANGKHIDTGAGAVAKMTLEAKGTPEGQLVPSINNAVVYSPGPGETYAGEWILELSGDFGKDQSTVTVNGTQLTVHTWLDNSIIARLPDSMSSPGSSGDVVVEVRGHKSNILPLTQWTGTVSQAQVNTDIGVGAHVDISCPVRATTDVHYRRNLPGETPTLITLMGIEVTTACTYTLSGNWSDGGNQYELSGSGQAVPLVLLKVYGNLVYPGPAATLPADFSGGLSPTITVSGTLKATDSSNNETTQPVSAIWAFAQTGINTTSITLGADYHFSTARSCKGLAGATPIQCTETWNMTPLLFTTPVSDTQS